MSELPRLVELVNVGLVGSASADVRYIYIIHEADDLEHCKVGRARHPEWRRMELQSGNRRRLLLHCAWSIQGRALTVRFEDSIHSRLWKRVTAGEWFNVSPEVAAEAARKVFREAGVDWDV